MIIYGETLNSAVYVCIEMFLLHLHAMKIHSLYNRTLVRILLRSFFYCRLIRVLDEIWDLIESVSEGFLTYSFILFPYNSYSCMYVMNCNLRAMHNNICVC